jgi:hypothetical protein
MAPGAVEDQGKICRPMRGLYHLRLAPVALGGEDERKKLAGSRIPLLGALWLGTV